MPYVSSHDTRLYYETHGAGATTIVFAHGMGGNAAVWYQQLARFSGEYRTVTFDHRYFARSSCAESRFDPRLFPDDIMTIMDAAGVDDAVFVCQSMGGWTGSQMAVSHPDRVRGLVMSHTPGIFVNVRAVNDMPTLSARVSQPAQGFRSAALADDFAEKNLAGAVLYNQISRFNGIDPAVIPRKLDAAGLAVDTDSLSSYEVPTLFVTADKDTLFPPRYIESLAASLRGARYLNLGDAGHSSYFEIPGAFNAALSDFIKAL